MSAQPLTEARQSTISDQTDRTSLEVELRRFDEAYTILRGRRARPELREAVADLLVWFGRVSRVEGRRIIRSIPAIARELGWVTGDGTGEEIRNRYRNQIFRRLDTLQEIGWVEGYCEVPGTRSRAAGILIELSPAGVAQSVEAAADVSVTPEGR